MHLVLVGPGALGSLFTVRLAPHLQEEGDALFLLDHNPVRARNLTRTGFSLQQNDSLFHASVQVTADPHATPACDVLLLCVKAMHVEKALLHAAPLITKNTLVIGLQNGMAHPDTLLKTAGIAAAATSSVGATLKEPGRVLFGGAGLTRFGLLAGNRPVPKKLNEIVTLFSRAGMEAELVDDIYASLWEKLFVNVGINALTAIHGRKNGWLLTTEATRETMKGAIAEAVAIAKAKKISIPTDPLALTFSVCEQTKDNVSSMLQDIRNKRLTEIDAINGYIIEAGEKLGIPTPVNKELVRQVRGIEQSRQALE